jgi:hypothetical protein
MVISKSGALETAQQSKGKDIMNSVLNVIKSALIKVLRWVVVYDKYKTALVSDPHHRIALVDFLWPESPRLAVSGFQGRRKSTCAIRWLADQTRVQFSYYHILSKLRNIHKTPIKRHETVSDKI